MGRVTGTRGKRKGVRKGRKGEERAVVGKWKVIERERGRENKCRKAGRKGRQVVGSGVVGKWA